VLPMASGTFYNFLLFVATTKKPISGYFIGRHRVMKFSEAVNGQTTFAVMACPRSVNLSSLTTPFYKMSFAYMSEPKPTAPYIVMLGVAGDMHFASKIAAKWNCRIRDAIQGSLTDVSRKKLSKAGSTFGHAPMTFFEERDQALRAAGRNVSDNN
jgi:hypothetical protein